MREALAKPMEDLGNLFEEQEREILALRERVRELEARLSPPAADDLKRIYGIGPVLEGRLNGLGILRFEQIGRWSDEEIDAMQAQLPEHPGRIRREAWVKSARDQYRKKYKEVLTLK